MPTLIPSQPEFTTASEQAVFTRLASTLGERDVLICNQHLSTTQGDREIDLVVVLDGLGVVVVEIKGSGIDSDADGWTMIYDGKRRRINPVEQARRNKSALIDYLKQHSSMTGFRPWAHAVVLPYTRVDNTFALPDALRGQVAGRDDMPDLAGFLRRILADRPVRAPFGAADRERMLRAMRGHALPQRDLVAVAAENAVRIEHRTAQQATILDVAALLPRIHVRGGAGTGKTWLAVEQARRVAAQGKRVALMCYSRGLAAWLQRRVATFEPHERPAYVGTFHGLGAQWGMPPGTDDDSEYWEDRLPALMVEHATDMHPDELFDAIVIDEGQDFAGSWWNAVLTALKDDGSRLAVFTDEGQQVFSRFGQLPAGLAPLVLDRNLRNTRQVAGTFETLAPIRMKLGDLDGPAVRLVECATDDAMDRADDTVDELLESGWEPKDVALLCTGSRHPEQRSRQDEGQDSYWASFWDADQVFYGHVLGFKGLERNAVVLAVNNREHDERAREKLYVGLSRAQEQLVVCGDPEYIARVGGDEVVRRLRAR